MWVSGKFGEVEKNEATIEKSHNHGIGYGNEETSGNKYIDFADIGIGQEGFIFHRSPKKR